ncbi:energy transducer TonB family protein [Mucilaginibacter lacusdianchii]|uniref:energy transducer TonB family protein n=1 Tax=Mucilaginibacter lacusdianchii TaxID=2684211 RepID=UPI00131C5691|nr:energy transducer TonB [Mucilaginibacter sp. JXJ CY 39]
MKKLLISLAFIVSTFGAKAQTDIFGDVYLYADKIYPSADWVSKFNKFLNKNLKPLKQVTIDGTTAEIVVQLEVEPDGKITAVRISKSLSSDGDAEVLRVVKLFARKKPISGLIDSNNTQKTVVTIPIQLPVSLKNR